MEKLCTRCNKSLPVESFRWKNKDKGWRQAYCIPCNIAYNKEHYQKNKSDYFAKAKKWDKAQYQKVIDYLRTHPCVDCGESDIVCLEFDHLDRANKSIGISNAIGAGWNWTRLQTEIEKCVVRCRNCHAKVTAKQFNWFKLIAD